MTIEHEFRETDDRCKWCGAPKAWHATTPQNCVPRWGAAPADRPAGALREYAIYDQDAIHAGIVRLREEREAVWSQTEEPQT